MLYEFAPDLRVLAARGNGDYKEVNLSDLLPYGFGPKSLT
jgi:cytidine deaminase